MITHDEMMTRTAEMPMKQITIDGEAYLQRYYAGTFLGGADLIIHRIMRPDAGHRLHNHGFEFHTVMSCGRYVEQMPGGNRETVASDFFGVENLDRLTELARDGFRRPPFLGGRDVGIFDWHRISDVENNTWTVLMIMPKRLPFWYFANGDGTFEAVESSPKEWWHDYRPRGQNPGDVI